MSKPSSSNKFTILSRDEYYDDLTTKIKHTKPGDRVRLMTMSFKPEKSQIDGVLKSLNDAAERGVNVHFFIDSYAFLIGRHDFPGPLFFFRKLPRLMREPFRTRFETLETLRQSGVKNTLINRPRHILSNPLAGRSHIKIAVINDLVYIGGCNLSTRDHSDLMVRWSDRMTANRLDVLLSKLMNDTTVKNVMNKKDQHFSINPTTTMLIDSGIPRQSLIFDTALSIIDGARDFIVITSQYFPNQKVAQHLKMAHERGVDVKIIYNSPSRHPFPYSVLMRAVLRRERIRLPTSFFEDELPKNNNYLHAKLLYTDQGTIVGSHNFIPLGVKLGTSEIALLSKDKYFGEKVAKLLLGQVSLKNIL